MRGRILGLGVISGDDGNRYHYAIEDIRNLDGRAESSLVNAEVDFTLSGDGTGNAKDIFITKQSFNLNAITQDNSINSIKIKAYIGLGFFLLAYTPIVGWFFSIIGFVAMVMALLAITSVTKIALLRNYILAWGAMFIGSIVGALGAIGGFLGAGVGSDAGIGAAGVIMVISGLLIVAGLVFSYFYYNNLSIATNEKMFFYVFICKVIAGLTFWLLFVGLIFNFISIVLEFIAWFKFRALKKPE